MRDIREDFEHNFAGMTAEPIALSDLLAARERLAHELQTGLDANERQFLLSLVNNAPEWSLMDTPHLEALPGIRWKLRNLAALEKTNPAKFRAQAKALTDLLSCDLTGSTPQIFLPDRTRLNQPSLFRRNLGVLPRPRLQKYP
jgi:hypothetical protein